VSTYQKYKCVEITECKLYMRVDGTGSFRPNYLFASGRFAPESESIRPT
jgi:hypothetical protein